MIHEAAGARARRILPWRQPQPVLPKLEVLPRAKQGTAPRLCSSSGNGSEMKEAACPGTPIAGLTDPALLAPRKLHRVKETMRGQQKACVLLYCLPLLPHVQSQAGSGPTAKSALALALLPVCCSCRVIKTSVLSERPQPSTIWAMQSSMSQDTSNAPPLQPGLAVGVVAACRSFASSVRISGKQVLGPHGASSHF